jgi:hypothetical protein
MVIPTLFRFSYHAVHALTLASAKLLYSPYVINPVALQPGVPILTPEIAPGKEYLGFFIDVELRDTSPREPIAPPVVLRRNQPLEGENSNSRDFH